MFKFGIFEKLYKEVEDEEELDEGSEELEEQDEEEEGDDPDEEEEESSVDPDTAKALEIYKALNNKATAPGMMALLNAQLTANGLAPVTKAELKDISINDILKEGFGEEYAFLHEKLGPAFEKAMNHLVDSKVGGKLTNLEAANQNLREEIAATKISAALDPFIEKMGAEEFDKIAPELSKTMEKYPNTSGIPMKQYIKEMLELTTGIRNNPKNVEKVRKNVREARRNLANGVEHKTVKNGSKTPSIREAVEAASRGITFED